MASRVKRSCIWSTLILVGLPSCPRGFAVLSSRVCRPVLALPMESPHPDERPAKKRRFFAEDSSPAQTRPKHSNPPPQSPPRAPSSPIRTRTPDGRDGHDAAAALDGFDVGMLQAVVGELPHATLQKLKHVSSSNVERGACYCKADSSRLPNAMQQSTCTSTARGPLHPSPHPPRSSNRAPQPSRRP